jgi:REP element-mobilizing transposase RayT
MGREPRPQIPGGIYHVGTRGIRRQPIYHDFLDFQSFLDLLAEASNRCGWRINGYCLMTNHYHLIVETPEPNISVGMHYVNNVHAKQFNRRYGFEGHLFDRRFFSELVTSDAQLVTTHRYVVLNPIRARMCTDPAQWPWSSYRASVGLETPADFLHLDHLETYFGRAGTDSQTRFRAFIAEAVAAVLST